MAKGERTSVSTFLAMQLFLLASCLSCPLLLTLYLSPLSKLNDTLFLFKEA